MEAFEIEADADRRILRTYFRGRVAAGDMDAAVERSTRLIGEMEPGFTVITDLSALEQMELDCVRPITRLMDQFRRARVGRVLRIIPDANKDIGFTLLSHTHYRGQVPFVTLSSIVEAETALARSDGRASVLQTPGIP